MATETSIRIKLTADGKGLIGQTKLSQEQLRKLGAEFDRTSKTKGRYNAEAKRTTDSMNRMHRSARALGTALGALGVTLSVRAFSRATTGALNAADTIGKMARQTGVAAESLQAWDFAASQNGVTANGLTSSLERLTRRIGEARTGTGEFARVSRELGLDLSDTESVLYQVADAIKGAKDEAEQAYIANAAFGRGGMEMVRMLQAGSTGLKQFEQRARELGLVINDDLIAKSERVNDALDRMRRQMSVAFQRGILTGLIGEFDDFESAVASQELQGALEDIGYLIGQLGAAARTAAEGFGRLTQEWRIWSGNIREGNEIELVNRIQKVRSEIERLENQRRISPMQRSTLMDLREELEGLLEQFSQIRRSHGDMPAAVLDPITVSVSEIGEAAAEAVDPLEDLRKSLGALQDRLDPVGASTRRYTEEMDTLDQAWATGLITGERYWDLMTRLATGTSEATTAAATMADTVEPVADEFAVIWEESIKRIDGQFVDLWESILSGSGASMDAIRKTFIRMIAEMAHAAMTRQITVQMGLAQQGMGGGGTGGSITQSLLGRAGQFAGQAVFGSSAAYGGISGIAAGGQQAAMLAGQTGVFGAAGLGATATAAGGSAIGATVMAAAPWAVGILAAGAAFKKLFGGDEEARKIRQLRDARREELNAVEDQIGVQIAQIRGTYDLTAAREAELSQMHVHLHEQQRRVWALQDELEALQQLERVNSERLSLEQRYYSMIGDTNRLRQLEIQQTEAANRHILRFIFRIEDQMAKVAAAEARARGAFASIQAGVASQRQALEERFAPRLSMLSGTVDTLNRQAVPSAPSGMQRAQAQSFLQMSRAAGVDAVDQTQLQRALDIVSQPSEHLFESFEEYQLDFLKTKRIVEEIHDAAQTQYNEEVQRLDGILETAQGQLNALMGIDDSVLSVEEAVRELAAAIKETEAARAQLAYMQSRAPSFNPMSPSSVAGAFNAYSYGAKNPDLVAFYQARVSAHAKIGIHSLNDFLSHHWHTQGQAEGRQFARGGMHSGGMRLVGEQGPELEVTGPSRIYSASDTQRMLSRSDPALVLEMRRLHSQVERLNQLQMQNTKASLHTSRQLQRWDVDGMPETREVSA